MATAKKAAQKAKTPVTAKKVAPAKVAPKAVAPKAVAAPAKVVKPAAKAQAQC
jgi:hypothetical protein